MSRDFDKVSGSRFQSSENEYLLPRRHIVGHQLELMLDFGSSVFDDVIQNGTTTVRKRVQSQGQHGAIDYQKAAKVWDIGYWKCKIEIHVH